MSAPPSLRAQQGCSQSAESAIGFAGRLQRHQIVGLRNRGSCSIPNTLTNPDDSHSLCADILVTPENVWGFLELGSPLSR